MRARHVDTHPETEEEADAPTSTPSETVTAGGPINENRDRTRPSRPRAGIHAADPDVGAVLDELDRMTRDERDALIWNPDGSLR